MTNLYTVARSDGENRETNLTLEEAARAILEHDGGQWEIRFSDGEFRIWARTPGVAMRGTPWLSYETERAAAEHEMFGKVVKASMDPDFRGLHGRLQSEYDADMARMANREAE